MREESGRFTGSVCPSGGSYRHGFCKNRHGYFQDPSIWARIAGNMRVTGPEKALFGIVIREDNSRDRLQHVGTWKNHGFSWKSGIRLSRWTLTYRETGVVDQALIGGIPGADHEPGKKEPVTGSDSLPGRQYRHSFMKNRHGYLRNPAIWRRIDGMGRVSGLEKALFGTVTGSDRFSNRTADGRKLKNGLFETTPSRRIII